MTATALLERMTKDRVEQYRTDANALSTSAEVRADLLRAQLEEDGARTRAALVAADKPAIWALVEAPCADLSSVGAFQ